MQRSHSPKDDGYHYHANSAKENQVIACLKGQTAASDDAAGRGGGGPPPGAGAPPG